MKTAIKVFLILSYVGAGLTALGSLSYLAEGDTAIGIAQLVNAAIVVAVSIIAQKKLATATCRRDLLAIGIFTLLFSSLIAGILMLCISDRELMPKNQQFNPYGNPYNNPYGNPYGNPYSNPYNGPYGAPYGGQYQNPNGQQYQNPNNPYGNPNGQYGSPNNQYQNPGNTYGSPYGNPNGTPFTAPQNEAKDEPAQTTEENKDDTPTDQE